MPLNLRGTSLVIYDDAAAHLSMAAFPDGAPVELAGTHMGLLLGWCFEMGWAGDVHLDARPEAIDAVLAGDILGADFVFAHCAGALRDEDVAQEARAFLAAYCADDGVFWSDYVGLVGGVPYQTVEEDVDRAAFDAMVDARYDAHVQAALQEKEGGSLTRFRQSDEAKRANGDRNAAPVIPFRETGWGVALFGVGLLLFVAKNCQG